jgi:hypothetical protein
MRRLLLVTVLIAVLLFVLMAGTGLAAAAILLGNPSVASSQDNDLAGLAEAFAFSASDSGDAQSISVYVDGDSSASGLDVGLYADNRGHPGDLLASGSDSDPTAGGWNDVTLDSNPTLSSGSTYWLAVLGTGGQLDFRDVADPGTGGCSENSQQSSLASLPPGWTTGATWPTCSLSAYVNGTACSGTVCSAEAPAPTNTNLPVISGTDTQGQVLTTSDGSWTGSPTSFAYQWQDCSGASCTKISGATSSSYELVESDVGDSVDVVVTATNAGGSTTATSTQTATVSASDSGGTLPTGVTLQPIDGGPNYYCSHDFTNACDGGWDNPSFFPIGPYWGDYVAATWADVGWNTGFRVNSPDTPTMDANGVFSVVASNDDTSGGTEAPVEPTTVGLMTNDEPNCWSSPTCGGNGPITPAIANTPNSAQDGRFWWVNDTWGFLQQGPPDGTPGDTDADFYTDTVTTPDGTTRHQDIGSVDEYWFSDVAGEYPTTYEGGLQYGIPAGTNGGELTTAQDECGCRYGDMIDYVPGTTVGLDPNGDGADSVFEREVQDPSSPQGNSNSVPAPIAAFVEDGNVGASASGTINPPEMNWAVWSSIIHGARMLIYFDHSFAGNCEGDDNIDDSCYQVPYSGQSISIYAQVKATDELIEQLATDINSPLANNYVTVEGTPGSLNGPPATFSGIETRATYNQSAGHFTIFADTRDAETSDPGTVTFHTADKYTGPVTVVCDTLTGGNGDLNPGTCVNRTVTATNGAFSDTFAKGSTVHIYQIP